MTIVFTANADGTHTADLPKSKPPPPQPGFSLSDLKPFLPDPFIEETSGKTLDDIVLEDVWCDMIRSTTHEVLEDPPGENDKLWELLHELVLDPDANGNPRFMP